MPRWDASVGPWIDTGSPAKRISPLSIGWMPVPPRLPGHAYPLTTVDSSAGADAQFLAGRGGLGDADLGALDLAVVDHLLDVVPGDQLRLEEHRLHLAVALRVGDRGGGERVGCRGVA